MNSPLLVSEGLIDYVVIDRSRNNGAIHIVEKFIRSDDQNFYRIKITSTWISLPYEVVSSRTANFFENRLVKHLQKITHKSDITRCDNECCARFKGQKQLYSSVLLEMNPTAYTTAPLQQPVIRMNQIFVLLHIF